MDASKHLFFIFGITTATIVIFTQPGKAQVGLQSCQVLTPLDKQTFTNRATVAPFNYASDENTIGGLVENSVLASRGVPKNATSFNGYIPDAVRGLQITVFDSSGAILYMSPIYSNSVFIDSKAITSGGSVSNDAQAQSFIASLAVSPAGMAPDVPAPPPLPSDFPIRATPILEYFTTSGVSIPSSLTSLGTSSRVLLEQANTCDNGTTGGLTIGASVPLNPDVLQPPASGSRPAATPPIEPVGSPVAINIGAINITSITPTTQATGRIVQIRGVNFLGDTASGTTLTLTFNSPSGDVNAMVISRSNTLIRAVVPNNASTGNIKARVAKIQQIGPVITVTP